MLWLGSASVEVFIGWWRHISWMSSNSRQSAPLAMAERIWVDG
jgi:hypothetical protein